MLSVYDDRSPSWRSRQEGYISTVYNPVHDASDVEAWAHNLLKSSLFQLITIIVRSSLYICPKNDMPTRALWSRVQTPVLPQLPDVVLENRFTVSPALRPHSGDTLTAFVGSEINRASQGARSASGMLLQYY